MKYFIALLLGLVTGVALTALGLLYNPFNESQDVSPLTVTDSRTIMVSFPAASTDNLLFSNDGMSRRKPQPEDVLQLWERPIRDTNAQVSVVRDARNLPAGIGVKFSSASEATDPLQGEALVNSVWYLYLPNRGSLFVEQVENHFDIWRDIAFPAYRSSGKSWRGNWLGNLTAGPGALQTARVIGGNGGFSGHEMIGLETLSLTAWSAAEGPVSGEGRLIFELPEDYGQTVSPQAP